MQSSEDTILCPQITSVIVTILKIAGPIFLVTGSNGYGLAFSWAFIDPLFTLIVTIFVILGIKNKNYGFYNCAQITCIVFSILETIGIAIALVAILALGVLVNKTIDNTTKNNPTTIPTIPTTIPNPFLYDINKDATEIVKTGSNLVVTFMVIALSLAGVFVWLLTCVLICYNKRVRYYCDNITSRQINNVINQPLV